MARVRVENLTWINVKIQFIGLANKLDELFFDKGDDGQWKPFLWIIQLSWGGFG